MLLAVDIGNTNIVVGVFVGDRILAQWRLSTRADRMPDEYAVELASLFSLANLDRSRIRGVVVASVVPAAEAAFREAARILLHVEPLVVTPALDVGIPIAYRPPDAVAPDRVANAVAAIHRYGKPAIVVDFGTGTNFDVVDAEGTFVGGAIAPGMEISLEALVAHASRLGQIPLHAPPSAIGTSTAESLQSGVIFGYAGLVDGLVDRMRADLEGDPVVIATGGLAGLIAPQTRSVQHIDVGLTLVGLSILYARNTDHADCARTR